MQIEPVGRRKRGGGYTVCALSSGLAAAVNDDTSEEIYVDAALPLVLEGVPPSYSLLSPPSLGTREAAELAFKFA